MEKYVFEENFFVSCFQGSMNDDNLGFGLLGGKDDPQAPNDNSIFVGSVQEGSTADGKLRVNDQLLKVNNVDVTNVEKKIAIQALRSGGGTINMVSMGQLTVINPYAAGVYLGQYEMMQKTWKIIETWPNGYSSESTLRKLSNEYQHDRDWLI